MNSDLKAERLERSIDDLRRDVSDLKSSLSMFKLAAALGGWILFLMLASSLIVQVKGTNSVLDRLPPLASAPR